MLRMMICFGIFPRKWSLLSRSFLPSEGARGHPGWSSARFWKDPVSVEAPPAMEQRNNHRNPTKKEEETSAQRFRQSATGGSSLRPHLAIRSESIFCQFPTQLNDKPSSAVLSIQMEEEHLNNRQEQSEQTEPSALTVPVALPATLQEGKG